MSLETLIEAAEYVDNVESTTADERSNSNTSNCITMTSSQTTIKTSKDVTIQHWRKRAVAQSVKELSKTSDIDKDDSSSEKLDTSTPEANLLIGSDFVTKTQISSSPEDECAVETTSSAAKSTSSERLLNGTGTRGTGSVSALHETFSVALARTAPVVSAPLLYASVPLGAFAIHDANSSRPQLGAMPSASGEVSGTPSQSLPGHRTRMDLPLDGQRKKTQLGAITREAHNKLEKSRRAHLKGCYHRLRSVVPNLRSKVSNLVILREALKYVQQLQQKGALLEEEHSSLMKQKAMKELKVQTMKRELLRHMKPAELDELLRRVGLNGIFKSEESGTGSPSIANPSVTNPSSTNACLSASANTSQNQPTTSTKTSMHPLSSPLLTPAVTTSLLVSSGSALPSTVSLVWESKNDSRRVCTMLPAPQMLSSTQIRQKADEQVIVKSSVCSHGSLRHSPVSSLTHFKPISANSESLSNVKSYTGWNITSAEMPSFMEGRRSPLKIVVKPVDSAKQQARVAKSTSVHQKVLKTVSCAETNLSQKLSCPKTKTNELVFRPRSSITPPPPSNITPYFPRFSVGSGGSPPLTTILPNMSDGSNQSVGDVSEAEQPGISVWHPRGNSDTELAETGNDGKEKMSIKRKMEVSLTGNASTKISKIQTPDLQVVSSGCSSSSTPEVQKASHIPSNVPPGLSMSAKVITSTVLIPITTPFSSPLSSQSRSVTQVCFSTITSSRPAIPASLHQITKTDDVSTGSFAMPATPALAIRGPNQNSQPNRYQFPLTMMTPIMSPSSGHVSALKSNPPPSGSRPDSASSTDSQPGPSVKMAAPQVQYMIPMGYPGMIAMPNGTPMAFPQPVGGFIPMMPSQGQGCGYIIPQGMMMMKSPDPPSEPDRNTPNGDTRQTNTPGANCEQLNPPVHNGNVFSPNQGMQPMMMAVQPGFIEPSTKQHQSNSAPQQIQMMPPGFQPANPIMVPVAADQAGAFMFGGTPTMMTANQGVGFQMPMNIIGYPMQMGGATMQFAMPQGSVSMQRGFSFGFAGGVQGGMMAVGSASRRGSISGSDTEGVNTA